MSGEAEGASAPEGDERGHLRPEGDVPPERSALSAGQVLRVRLGHGANCSSIGSLVDAIFAVATVGGAVFAAVVAAMDTEPVRVAGASPEHDAPSDPALDPRDPRELP